MPSRIAYLIEAAGQDPSPTLAAMAQRLQAAGAQALAMPCNTAHHFAPQIRAAVGVPFLDMVALSVAHAQALADGSALWGFWPPPLCAGSGCWMRR